MPGDAELTVRIETKSYRDASGRRHEVLRDVAFTETGGKILALLGPSGAGKTTVLRIVLGLDRDFQGKVALPHGRLGVMFQEPRLLPWLSVAANLRLVAGDAASDIPALLAEAGLAGTEELHPKALSLGMARRVALVRALLGRPRLLCLDEPFASLDPKSAADLALLLARTARRLGALVLLSTHDLDQVLGLADRLLVLSGKPASLAADWPTRRPAATNGLATLPIKQDLLTRFPFLRGETASETAP
jgi:NitT/TauT family transport system ATP-binding protein